MRERLLNGFATSFSCGNNLRPFLTAESQLLCCVMHCYDSAHITHVQINFLFTKWKTKFKIL